MTVQPYSRVYWSIVDDPKFATVYDDDRALATWLRLLIVADQAWPSSAHLPASANRKAVAVLVSVGLVDIQTGGRYRIHGLDAERERRSAAGNAGASARWNATAMRPHSDRIAKPDAVPLQDETSTRRDEYEPSPRAVDDEYDKAVAWLASRKAWLDSPKVQVELARMVDKKGAASVIEAMDKVPEAETAAQFVYGARNALFPLRGTVVAKPEDQSQATFDRGVERTQRMLRELRGESA